MNHWAFSLQTVTANAAWVADSKPCCYLLVVCIKWLLWSIHMLDRTAAGGTTAWRGTFLSTGIGWNGGRTQLIYTLLYTLCNMMKLWNRIISVRTSLLTSTDLIYHKKRCLGHLYHRTDSSHAHTLLRRFNTNVRFACCRGPQCTKIPVCPPCIFPGMSLWKLPGFAKESSPAASEAFHSLPTRAIMTCWSSTPASH